MEPLPFPFNFPLRRKVDVWADNVVELLDRAGKETWNTEEITRLKPTILSSEAEPALCQLLTFFLEHKYLSLYSASKFIPTISPYFGEVALLLSHHAQDEAKHINVLAKRVEIGGGYQTISAATQFALKSVLDINDFSKAVFVHDVMGEATIVDIMAALGSVLIDDSTRHIFDRIRADEERHIAYGIAKTKYRIEREPDYGNVLVNAVDERASYFFVVAGAEETIKNSVAMLLAGDSSEESSGEGLAKLKTMHETIEQKRFDRLIKAGLGQTEAKKILEITALSGSGIC